VLPTRAASETPLPADAVVPDAVETGRDDERRDETGAVDVAAEEERSSSAVPPADPFTFFFFFFGLLAWARSNELALLCPDPWPLLVLGFL
jgi:hypothetical protein